MSGDRSPAINYRLLILGVAAFLLVAGVGVVVSTVGQSAGWTAAPASASSDADHDLGDEALARLEVYAGASMQKASPAKSVAGQVLPDVDTMIQRLVARLEDNPADLQGWQMLGWSYHHTGRHQQAAHAYEKALQLAPGSSDIKAAYEQAKANVNANKLDHK